MERKFVLDQNKLRDEHLIESIVNTNDQIVIIDEALIEMSKSPTWDETMHSSLRYLAQHPSQVLVTKAPSLILQHEVTTQKPVSPSELVDQDVTQRFQVFLQEIARDPANATSSIIHRRDQAIQGALQQQLNHEQNRRTLLGVADGWKADLEAEQTKAVKSEWSDFKNKAATSFSLTVELLSDLDGCVTVARGLMDGYGVQSTQAAALMVANLSFGARQVLMLHLYALKMLGTNVGAGMPAKKFTNELMDMDYIVMSTYFDDLHTTDRSTRLMCDLLSQILPRVRASTT